MMKIISTLTKFLAIPFFLGIAGCQKNDTKAQSVVNDGNSIKFMSYNIHIGNPPSQPSSVVDMEGIAKVINNAKPDFVALQEVDRFTDRSGKNLDQAAKLAELTGMNYKFFKAIDRSNGEYGLAVLSKYPIVESNQVTLNFIPGSGAESRTAGWIRVKLENDQDLVFGTVHLDHISDANRHAQSRELLAALKSYQKYPIVMGGDFNMNQSNSIWDLLKVIFTVPCTNCPSTHSATKPTTAIDYLIMNEKATEVFNKKSYATYPETYASDHLPVVLELNHKK